MIIKILIAFCIVMPTINCKNILFLNLVASPSHHIFNRAIINGIADRGHNVTVVSPDIEQKTPPNIHYIHLENMYSHLYNGSEPLDLLAESKISSLEYVPHFWHYADLMCEGARISDGIETIKNYPKNFKFDLVVIDYSCGSCLLGLLPKFNYPPVVGVSAFKNPPYTNDIVGADKLALTASPFYIIDFDISASFFHRFFNGLVHFYDSLYRKYISNPRIDKIMRNTFGTNLPYIGELEDKIELFLVNANPIFDPPDLLPQNVIQIGGVQIQAAKPLPEDIKKFLDAGKKGSILMSLGTNIRSDSLNDETLNQIVETFRQYPDYNFIWKFETDGKLKNLPKNLQIRAWVPQNDVLAHPNIKAFISHGGLLSSHEAIWWGVPILGMPFIADQYQNLKQLARLGVAVKVDPNTLTTAIMKDALREILLPKYLDNVKRRSKLFQDQKEHPLERAIWWLEYVMRNTKLTHLKKTPYKLGLLGSAYWDIQMIIILMFVLLFHLIRALILKIKRNTSSNITESKKRN